ncbi:hypothetical protein EGW08_007411, partial [Elysia chlorotica]
MPFLHSKSEKEKEHKSPNQKYYVEFLGWMECHGVRGERYTRPVIQELRRRQQKNTSDRPPKLTIEVSHEKLRISQEVDTKKKDGIKKIEFPKIPGRDVTFVHQASRPSDGRPDDTVACIYLGYMPRTKRYVHVHVYRFMDAQTASKFAAQMAAIVSANSKHVAEAERKLASKGQIEPPLVAGFMSSEPRTTDSAVGSASSGYSDDESPVIGTRDIEPDLQSLHEVMAFDSVTEEFRHRMKLEEAPVLLPPKDYDTIKLKHGNLALIDLRRCNEERIVGDLALKNKHRAASSESGVDVGPPGAE